MTIKDETCPSIKVDARLMGDGTLWIKTDKLDKVGRVLVEHGTRCKQFYQDAQPEQQKGCEISEEKNDALKKLLWHGSRPKVDLPESDKYTLRQNSDLLAGYSLGYIPIKNMGPKWIGKPTSNLIKWLMKKADMSNTVAGAYLGYDKTNLSAKLHRDSWRPHELFCLAEAAGFDTVLINKKTLEMYRIDPEKFYGPGYENIQKAGREAVHKEYLRAKDELARTAKEYGFEE